MAEALASQKKLEYIQSVYQYREAIFQLELLLDKDLSVVSRGEGSTETK